MSPGGFRNSTAFEFPTRGSGFIKFTLTQLSGSLRIAFYEEVGTSFGSYLRHLVLTISPSYVNFAFASSQELIYWALDNPGGPHDIWISVDTDSMVRVGQGTSVGSAGTFVEAQYDANRTTTVKYMLFEYNAGPGTDPLTMTNVVVGTLPPV